MSRGLPSQKVTQRQRDEQWVKDTLDYYIRLSYTTTTGNRTTNYNKLINYDLFNGKFNKADLEYVCNPLGLSDHEFPATLQHYDCISEPLRLLISEEATRPDNQLVISESPLDINRKNKDIIQKLINHFKEEMMMQAQAQANPEQGQQQPQEQPQLPEDILKYESQSTSDLIEGKANRLHKILKKKLNTKEVFKKGWKDSLIAGEEIYWIGIINGEPALRRCNPVNTTIVLDADSDFIDDAIAVVETRLLSLSTIIDEFGDEITPNQISDLEKSYGLGNKQSLFPSSGFIPDLSLSSNGLNGQASDHLGTYGDFNAHLIKVSRVEWKSYKKLYFISYTDEQGNFIEEMVDETFDYKLFKDTYEDFSKDELWVTEAWEGTKIGDDIYINCQAKANQRRRMDNPYVCKLGYTGLIYSATNSQSVSLIDRLKPYQYLYNVISYRLELAFASDQGKIFLMDLAQIPRSEGFDIDKWMYYLKAMKIGFINSFEEGRKGTSTGKISNFNQFQSIDLSLANQIQQYIQTLEHIKNQIYFVSGVTPQRMGAIESRELVGNVERSVSQSSMITEYLFDSHDEVKRRTYEALVECAKIAYRDGMVSQYVLDDMTIQLLHIEEGEFENSEFAVFMSNSNKDRAVQESLKQLSQMAMQSEKADLSTIIDITINDSPREIIRTLQRKEKEFYDRKQQESQQASQMQDQQLQHQEQLHKESMDLEYYKLELDKYISDSNNETKVHIAEIASYNRQDSLDQDMDGVPDPLEIGKLALAEQELSSKQFLEDRKHSNERFKHEKELAHKSKELQMKKEIEDKKIEAIKVQNASQEKIANKQLALKEKELKNKLQIERIKARNKPKK